MTAALFISSATLLLHYFSSLFIWATEKFLEIVPSSHYAEYKASWAQYNSLNRELHSISAQDEFAKWAKLSRQVQKAEEDCKEKGNIHTHHQSILRMKLSFAAKALTVCGYVALVWWLWDVEALFNGNSLCFTDFKEYYFNFTAFYWTLICAVSWYHLLP